MSDNAPEPSTHPTTAEEYKAIAAWAREVSEAMQTLPSFPRRVPLAMVRDCAKLQDLCAQAYSQAWLTGALANGAAAELQGQTQPDDPEMH